MILNILLEKSKNQMNLLNKKNQLKDNIKKINPNDLSKAKISENSGKINNSSDKFNLNKNKTKSSSHINLNNIINKNLEKNFVQDEKLVNVEIPPSTNRTDRTNLEKKMDSAIEYISNLNGEHIFEYTKSVIRDFLIFIKKVTSSNNEKEDLDCHFSVIINILNNVFIQMEKIAVSLDYENLNQFIPEEIFIQTFKIIITAPCFLLEIENILLPFIKKIRKIIDNDVKFFEIYYEILNKFICFEKGSSFLQGINPKNTFIVFYDFFLLDEPKFENLQILEKFEEFILKNIFFSEEEKSKYIMEYTKEIDMIENNQKKNMPVIKKTNIIEDYNNKDQSKEHSLEEELNINLRINVKDRLYDNVSNDIIQEQEYYDDKINVQIKEENFNLKSIQKGEKIINKFQEDLQSQENINLKKEDVNSVIKFIKESNEEQDKINRINSNITHQNIEENLENMTYNYPSNKYENNNSSERNPITEKIEELILPENLTKDISKIKDTIQEKCRKLNMNIKRINNKIENENNTNISTDKNYENNDPINSYMTNSNLKIYNDQNTSFNRFTEYKNRMLQQFNNNNMQQMDVNSSDNYIKPKRNLEDLENIEITNDFNDDIIKEDINNIHNIPKLNNFLENKLNNLQMNNRIYDLNNDSNNISVADNINSKVSANNLVLKNNNGINTSGSSELNEANNYNEKIKNLILKIPTIILEDSVSEISHYVLLENSFMKMNSEMKIELTNFLASTINNRSLISNSSFNCFLQLIEFMLTLLIFVSLINGFFIIR